MSSHRVIEFLEEVRLYLDARQDADCVGDPPRLVPNREMRLMQDLEEALDAAQAMRQALKQVLISDGFAVAMGQQGLGSAVRRTVKHALEGGAVAVSVPECSICRQRHGKEIRHACE